MNAYPAWMHESAARLRQKGWGYKRIAAELRVSSSTVVRWLDHAHHQRQLANARAYKRRRASNCIDCGTRVWLSSLRCRDCAEQHRREHPTWTKDRVINAIQEWAAIHGKRPSARDWIKRGKTHPAATSVYGHPCAPFRSWAEAVEAAGFPRPYSPPGPGNRSWQPEEARQLRAQGLTNEEIGKRFGVTGRAIANEIGQQTERRRPQKLPKRSREQRIADLHAALARSSETQI